jgi:hypothetical protein
MTATTCFTIDFLNWVDAVTKTRRAEYSQGIDGRRVATGGAVGADALRDRDLEIAPTGAWACSGSDLPIAMADRW